MCERSPDLSLEVEDGDEEEPPEDRLAVDWKSMLRLEKLI